MTKSDAEKQLAELLDRLPVETPAQQVLLDGAWKLLKDRQAAGITDARGYYIWYEVTRGPKSVVVASLARDFEMFDWAAGKRDPECGGWPEFSHMLQTGSSKCLYRWGINAFGHEFYRFGPEEFVHAKIHRHHQ
jgi:hypothetical protein